MSIVHEVSAGGVVYRHGERGVEIVLCKLKKTWRLPKGKVAEGEKIEQTALREVEEETGLKTRLEDKIGKISYWFFWDNIKHHKTVHFFLMSPIGGDISNHDIEFEEVSWFPIEEALRKLSFKTEREIVQRAYKSILQRNQGSS